MGKNIFPLDYLLLTFVIDCNCQVNLHSGCKIPSLFMKSRLILSVLLCFYLWACSTVFSNDSSKITILQMLKFSVSAESE